MRCPTCNGNILTNDNPHQDQCLQCGRYPNPEPVYQFLHSSHKKKIKISKPCVNCKRTKKIKAHDLCYCCYDSGIHAGKVGSPEFKKGLKKAKIRFSNPNYKGTRGSYIRPRKMKVSA